MTHGFIDGEYQDGELRGITFLGGIRGMGKTTEMDRLLSLCRGGVLFFDSISKHADVLKGYTLVHQPGELKQALRAARGRRFRILYQPRCGNLTEHFRGVCRIVEAAGSMIFAIDEVDKHCGAQWGDSRMPPELYDLVNYGRHHRVSMVATARYPNSVARGFLSQWEQLRLFCTTDPEHLWYYRKVTGLPKDVAERLITLQPYQYLLCDRGRTDATLCGGKRKR